MSTNNSSALLGQIAQSLGLKLLQVFSQERAEAIFRSHTPKLKIWQENGYAGEMHYMQRPVELFWDLNAFLPGVKSIATFLVPYRQVADWKLPPVPTPPEGFGRVARYAWGRDYHKVLKRKLARVVDEFSLQTGQSLGWRIFSDAVPLLERSLAAASTTGFIGRNSMFIQPGVGSFAFLAEVLFDQDFTDTQFAQAASPGEGCGTCRRCHTACPTGALVGDGILDARRCISYLTIEKRGALNAWEQNAIGDWLFGCDICQDVCPFNHANTESTKVEEFSKDNGAGPFLGLQSLLQIRTRNDFEKRFAGTPLMRAGREGLLRNACAVIANRRYFSALRELLMAQKTDSSEIVRDQATSALLSLLPHADGCDRSRILSAIHHITPNKSPAGEIFG